MELKQSLQLLQKQVDEIKGLASALEFSDTIRDIEVDLILDKLRDAYDVTLGLKSNSAKPSVQEPEPVQQAVKVDEVKEPINNEDAEEATREIEFEVEPGAQESEAVIEEKVHDVRGKQALVADQFHEGAPTLNEEISGDKRGTDISSKLSSQPISSVTSALGLNEKFELIKELFDGDQEQFNRTMEKLNHSSSFVEAYTYLEEDRKWDMDSPYVQRILELIRRKLITRRDEQ